MHIRSLSLSASPQAQQGGGLRAPERCFSASRFAPVTDDGWHLSQELFPQTETSVDCKPSPLRDCYMTFVLPVYRRHAEGDRRHMSLFKGGFVGIGWLRRNALGRIWSRAIWDSSEPRIAPLLCTSLQFYCEKQRFRGFSRSEWRDPGCGKSPGRPHLWFHLKR